MNWYDTAVEEPGFVTHHAMIKAESKPKAIDIAQETANSQGSTIPKKCRLLSVDDETIEYRRKNSASWPNRVERQGDNE